MFGFLAKAYYVKLSYRIAGLHLTMAKLCRSCGRKPKNTNLTK